MVHWLNNTELPHIREESYYSDSGAGYYRFDTQSYCLHAGAYSPTKGDGYLLAPLLGSLSEIIAHVLQRSALHPAINQRDIQVFIWATEAQTSYLDLPPDLRTRLAPLLTPKEMATLSEGSARKKITGLLRNRLPKAASDAMNTYEHLRSVITDASSTYKEIEAAAIKAGVTPASDNRADVPAGQWSYVGGNRYMRVFPSSYQHTVVELLKTAPYSLTRDETKHTMVFESEGLALKVAYTGDGSNGHPLTIETIQLPGDTRPVPLSARHIVISPSVKVNEGSATTQRAGANREIGLTQLVTALRADRAAQRRGNVETEVLQSIAKLSAFRNGVMSAFASTNASQQRVKRIADLLNLAVIQAACTAAGDCQPNQLDPEKGGTVSAAPAHAAENDGGPISAAGSPQLVLTSLGSRDSQAGGVAAPGSPQGWDVPGGIVAVPANTGNQRLGVSPRCSPPPKQCTTCPECKTCQGDSCVGPLGAARKLGLKRTTLIGKMRRMGILRSTEAALAPLPQSLALQKQIIHAGKGL